VKKHMKHSEKTPMIIHQLKASVGLSLVDMAASLT